MQILLNASIVLALVIIIPLFCLCCWNVIVKYYLIKWLGVDLLDILRVWNSDLEIEDKDLELDDLFYSRLAEKAQLLARTGLRLQKEEYQFASLVTDEDRRKEFIQSGKEMENFYNEIYEKTSHSKEEGTVMYFYDELDLNVPDVFWQNPESLALTEKFQSFIKEWNHFYFIIHRILPWTLMHILRRDKEHKYKELEYSES